MFNPASIGTKVHGLAARVRRRIAERLTHTLVRGADGATFAVFGDDTTVHRLAKLFLGEDAHATRTRRINSSGGRDATAMSLMKQHGMVVLYGKRPALLDSHLLTQPRFVPLVTDLLESEQAFIASVPSARGDIGRARRRGFTFEFESDPAWAREFHDRYHRPSIVGRHGDEAYVMSAEDIEERMRRHGAQFICVVRDGVRVVADLFEVTPEHLRLMRLGWLDGDYAHVKSGAVAAKYWFIFCHARKLGRRYVNLGGTPPQLDHGVMKYKMKWNPAIAPSTGFLGECHLLLDPAHPRVQRMLAASAFILHAPGGGYTVLSGMRPSDYHLGPRMRASLKAWHRVLPEPDAAREPANPLLPPALRAWAVREPMNDGR